jgi:hypothetical protein
MWASRFRRQHDLDQAAQTDGGDQIPHVVIPGLRGDDQSEGTGGGGDRSMSDWRHVTARGGRSLRAVEVGNVVTGMIEIFPTAAAAPT